MKWTRRSLWFLVLGTMFAIASVGPNSAARAETLTWRIQKYYPGTVHVRFFAKRRGVVWPSTTRAYVISDGRVTHYRLRCVRGEKICYGAWLAHRKNREWGLGHDGNSGCRNCCMICDGSETPIFDLNR